MSEGRDFYDMKGPYTCGPAETLAGALEVSAKMLPPWGTVRHMLRTAAARLEELEAENARLRDVVVAGMAAADLAEPCGVQGDEERYSNLSCCPVCPGTGTEDAIDHKPGCKLLAFMKAAREVLP